MTEQEYLDQRVTDQINWYDKKSAWHKRWFMTLKIIETVLALLIPLLVAYITSENRNLKIVVGLIGIIVAATTNIITLYKLQENWIQYRTVAESLNHEKFLFITKAGIYKENNSFPVFVERFEGYLSRENTQWAAYTQQKNEDAKNA